MFCPVCRSEYRAGFRRCESCQVDLVAEPVSTASAPGRTHRAVGPMLEYCGFLSLDEARDARSKLRKGRIASEILIRDVEDDGTGESVQEEYWLRVPSDAYKATAAILGYDFDDGSSGERAANLSCSDCGKNVSAEEKFCPHCGAGFE